MIGWYIGLIGSFVGIIGLYLFWQSLLKMSGKLRTALSTLFLSSCCVVFFSTAMSLLGLMQVEIKNSLWQSVPVMIFITAIIYYLGTRKLIRLIEKLINKNKNLR